MWIYKNNIYILTVKMVPPIPNPGVNVKVPFRRKKYKKTIC